MKKGFKIIAINLLVLCGLLLAAELFVGGIVVRKELLTEHYVMQLHSDEKVPDITITKYSKEYVKRVIDRHFVSKFNKYYELRDFRTPAVGKSYKGNKDIVLAGCSYAYGTGIEQEETFGEELARNLHDYKIYNAALEGGSPRETLYLLRNYKKCAEQGIFPENSANTKYFIYTFIGDQGRILFLDIFRISPVFKAYKDNNGIERLAYTEKRSIFDKSYIKFFFGYNYSPKLNDRMIKATTLYFSEMKLDVKKAFPNAKFILFVYDDENYDYDWSILEKEGITVLKLEEMSDIPIASDEKYLYKSHPNGLAWQIVVPILIKNLNMQK